MQINDKQVIAVNDNPSNDEYNEPFFSHNGCENCNNKLGNDVYRVEVYTALEDIELEDYYELELCQGCLCSYHNADELPEQCENVFNI